VTTWIVERDIIYPAAAKMDLTQKQAKVFWEPTVYALDLIHLNFIPVKEIFYPWLALDFVEQITQVLLSARNAVHVFTI
jgi:hypothetical protein